jgi:hypothetical protein
MKGASPSRQRLAQILPPLRCNPASIMRPTWQQAATGGNRRQRKALVVLPTSV